MVEPEEPIPKEGPSSQSLLSKAGPSVFLPASQGLHLAQAREEEVIEDEESQAKSEPSSGEEVDLDSEA